MSGHKPFSTLRERRLEDRLAEGRALIEAMDVRMQEGAAVDEDGWVVGYRLPTGPWHKLIAWARQGEPSRVSDPSGPEAGEPSNADTSPSGGEEVSSPASGPQNRTEADEPGMSAEPDTNQEGGDG